ncbi:protein ETHYLENE INSENSITIVE 3-like isoform 1 [Hibiscus syriacus]|uniref:Protein ETHYLENE INSENSITIVE 3-like isoform 1 n=1 Tax=Hibiscus syriacus TaxID=106335 RepID=A0A6A3BRA4_HIBSY|nr:protein ETHYLENE INSENSITIVE 3-like isoform 1 [Hibiscus syriacus]
MGCRYFTSELPRALSALLSTKLRRSSVARRPPNSLFPQIARRFIWGGSKVKPKIALVNWETCCQPNENGGLGLWSLRAQNEAFLIKLCYNFLIRPNSMREKIIRAKYKVKEMMPLSINSRNGSFVWKSLSKVWNHIRENVCWSIGDGQKTSFWHDVWINDMGFLQENVSTAHVPDSLATVRDFTLNSGDWNLPLLRQILPEDVVQRIFAMPPPSDLYGSNIPIWRWDQSGICSVKSAFNLLNKDNWDPRDYKWKIAWDFRGPQRIRSFIWLDSSTPRPRHRLNSVNGWKAPDHGVLKLNTDGSFHPTTLEAASGGVIRDIAGDWVVGFWRNVGRYLHRRWRMQVRHVPRETNTLADKIAKMGRGGSMGLTKLDAPPPGIQSSQPRPCVAEEKEHLLITVVDVVDKKLENEIGGLSRELNEIIEGRTALLEKALKKLEQKSEEFDKSFNEVTSADLLTKEEFGKMYEQMLKEKGENGVSEDPLSLSDLRAYAREILKDKIEKHASDGLVRVVCVVFRDADKILKPSFGEPVQCFPLKGSNGFVQIKSRAAIIPEAVTLEHVAKSVAYDRSSAPKDCRVSGWLQGRDPDFAVDPNKMFLLAEFTYDLEKSNAQTFDVLNSAGIDIVDTVRLDFSSNHGSASHTCIYRLRVHGHEPDSVSMVKTES